MPHSDKLSTGQAARMLSVTADTVLKWIKRGRLPASRTAGGHFRVRWADVQRLRVLGGAIAADEAPEPAVYCWQFHGEAGEASGNCVSCIVHRARALRCFELSGLHGIDSRAGTFCATSCLDCAYYLAHVHEQIGVLVVLDDPEQRAVLEHHESATASLALSYATCTYDTAIAIQQNPPEFVVLHCSVCDAQQLRDRILHDPRRPGIHVLIAGDAELADGSRPELPRRFTIGEFQAAIWAVHRAAAHGAATDRGSPAR